MRKILAFVMTAVALLVPAIAQAHEGHAHTFRGTISAINGPTLEMKTTDGKTLVFTLDAKTAIQRGRTRVDVKAIKGGERVVVSALEVPAGKTMTAQTVQLAAPAPVPSS
jgi:hypothetical protein